MATLKKPAAPAPKAPTAPKTAGKPAAKLAAPKTAATKPEKPKVEKAPLPDLQVGNIVTFKGYSTERKKDEIIFDAEAKPKLAIIGIDDAEGGGKVYTVVATEDYWSYMDKKEAGVADDDESMPAGDMLVEAEFTRGRYNKDTSSYPSVPEREKPVEVISIGKMDEYLAANGGDALVTAQNLVSESEQALFYTGGALATLKYKKEYCAYENPETPGVAYTPDGAGWQAFIAHNFPDNFGWRKAEGYIQIYTRVSLLPEPEKIIERLNDIGYAKAAMIAGHLTADNADELAEKAATQSVRELQVTIKNDYTSEDGKNAAGKAASRVSVKMLTLSFKFFEDQAVGVQYILDEAKKKLALDDSQTFEVILQQWASEHLSAEVVEKGAARSKAKLAAFKKANVALPKNHPLRIAEEKALAEVSAGPAAKAAGAPAKPALKPAGAAKAAVSAAVKGK